MNVYCNHNIKLLSWLKIITSVSKALFNHKRSIKIIYEHLKTLDTIGNFQRPVFSLGESQHMHKITNLWRFELDCEITMKEKTPLSHKVVCWQMLDFETSNSKLEVSKSNSWKITSFSKTTSLQRERFLTFYTINLSLL